MEATDEMTEEVGTIASDGRTWTGTDGASRDASGARIGAIIDGRGKTFDTT